MYRILGLESPWKNTIPDDHISLELDAVLALNHITSNTEEIEIKELRKQFFNHLKAWVPRFTKKIHDSSATHPAITFVARCLATWLAHQNELIEEEI
jgi:TorA maturation chaperone TorD